MNARYHTPHGVSIESGIPCLDIRAKDVDIDLSNDDDS